LLHYYYDYEFIIQTLPIIYTFNNELLIFYLWHKNLQIILTLLTI